MGIKFHRRAARHCQCSSTKFVLNFSLYVFTSNLLLHKSATDLHFTLRFAMLYGIIFETAQISALYCYYELLQLLFLDSTVLFFMYTNLYLSFLCWYRNSAVFHLVNSELRFCGFQNSRIRFSATPIIEHDRILVSDGVPSVA